MRMMLRGGLSALLLCLVGCAASSVTSVGDRVFPPLPATTDVRIFAHEREIAEPWMTVGIVHHHAPGSGLTITPYTLNDVLEPIKTRARSVGANGVIIDQTTRTGWHGQGLDVRARAIRLPEKLSTAP